MLTKNRELDSVNREAVQKSVVTQVMDRRRALVISVGVLMLVARCKKTFPSAYEYITSEMGITDQELMQAKELLQKEVEKEKLRGMAT